MRLKIGGEQVDNMNMESDYYFPISRIQHFYYCKRQWGLIELEQQWEDNYYTAEGNVVHENADDPFFREKRNDVIITRSVRVQSHKLCLSGICDVIEWQKQQEGDVGVSLEGQEGLWWPLVIEYKRGKRKNERSDAVQLCAQCMALEEMLGIKLFEAAFYYYQERGRVTLDLSDELRQETIDTAKEMFRIYESKETPKAKDMKRCQACSLKEICMPRLTARRKDVHAYIKRALAGDD